MLGPIIEVGIRMDGLDRLIEMLEKRFGKFWGDALLLLVVLGAASWAINATMTYVVLPVIKEAVGLYGYLSGVHISLPPEFFAVFSRLVTWVAIAIPITSAVLIFITRRLGKRLTIVEEGIMKELERHCEIISALKAERVTHLATIKKLEAENARLKSERPSHR